MATATNEVKRDIASGEHQKIEDLAEKTSTSSGEIEAQHVDVDDKEAQRVLRKVDLRLIPILSLLYLVAFIDRSNSTSLYYLLYGLIKSLTADSRQCEDCRNDDRSPHAQQHVTV